MSHLLIPNRPQHRWHHPGLILECGFAGFPQLEKMPHKIYIGALAHKIALNDRYWFSEIKYLRTPLTIRLMWPPLYTSKFIASVFVFCTFMCWSELFLFLLAYITITITIKKGKSPFASDETHLFMRQTSGILQLFESRPCQSTRESFPGKP